MILFLSSIFDPLSSIFGDASAKTIPDGCLLVREGEAPAEPLEARLGRSLALPEYLLAIGSSNPAAHQIEPGLNQFLDVDFPNVILNRLFDFREAGELHQRWP